jgi:hypothetical protein
MIPFALGDRSGQQAGFPKVFCVIACLASILDVKAGGDFSDSNSLGLSALLSCVFVRRSF